MANQGPLNEQIKKKFHGKTEIPSKYIPKYPVSAERDYIRMTNRFALEVLKPVLVESLPQLIQIINGDETKAPWAYQRSTGHFDAKDSQGKQAKKNQEERAKHRRAVLASVAAELDRWFERLRVSLETAMRSYRVRDRLNIIADANRKLTVKEWKKAIGKTLGINILEDYYDGAFYAEALEKWVDENVGLFVTIPNEMLDDMKRMVLDSYLKGDTVTTITKQIQHCYGTTKAHSRLIARDQIGKLNSQITRHQQKKCGINKYIWRTAGDGRVRDSHRELDRKVFDWDHPPVVDQKTGRRCHPGEDYQCRCIAAPVFNLDMLDLPVDGRAEKIKVKR